MPTDNNEYLSASYIKNERWVMETCRTNSASELSTLIVKRISTPTMFGPMISRCSLEMPSKIVCDLMTSGLIDYDLGNEAMAILMNKIVKRDSITDFSILRNIFNIIEQLAFENCSDDLFTWVKQNISFVESEKAIERNLILDALNALAYAQKENQDGVEELWDLLWEKDNQFLWNTAYLGLRYANFDKSLSIIPKLIERKCSNSPFILKSMARVSDNRFFEAIKAGIKEEKMWAGLAINDLAFDMKWAEKAKLINRLYDLLTASKEDEDFMAERNAF